MIPRPECLCLVTVALQVDCSFCDIAASRSPAPIVHQSEWVTAFLDHAPLFPGHTLVIPRLHVPTIEDMPDELVGPYFATVSRVARAVRMATGAQGTFVGMNNIVSQSVPHLHTHVVPRTKGDGLRGFFWPRTRYRDDTHREEVRAEIASQLGE